MRVQRESGRIDPPVLEPRRKIGWVVKAMLRPLYPQERNPMLLVQEVG